MAPRSTHEGVFEIRRWQPPSRATAVATASGAGVSVWIGAGSSASRRGVGARSALRENPWRNCLAGSVSSSSVRYPLVRKRILTVGQHLRHEPRLEIEVVRIEDFFDGVARPLRFDKARMPSGNLQRE